MDMTKYRGMFLNEARDHLQQMNALLPGLGEDPTDRTSIDALFREVHSVKGMAASMGYEQTAALTHQLEDLMHGFRQAGVFAPEAAERLQAGFDLLASLLDDIDADQPERDIALFLTGTAASIAPPTLAPTLPASPIPLPPVPASADENELQVVIRLTAEAAAPAARALLVLQELARLGQVVSSDPARDQLCRGGPVPTLQVRVRTPRRPAELRAALAAMPDLERITVAAPPRESGFRSRREDAVPSVRVSTAVLDRFISLTGEMITNRYLLQTAARAENWQSLREGLDRQARLVGDLHHHVLRVRMLTVESITGRLPRLVRELARRSGKEIRLHLEGEHVELDRTILEALADPLIHLVRNAVDHGIEESGEIAVRAWREQDQVLIEVADDGQGMDPALLRRKAVEKGLLTPAQARSVSDAEALHLVCLPGFSTAEQVTETSGRGVGMDVVKSKVETLGGSLDIRSAAGEGTRFSLKVPVSVAIVHLLLVECGGHQLGIPFTRVLRALELSRREIRTDGRKSVALIDGEEVPLLSLRKILALPGNRPGGSFPLVLTEARGRRIGLVVDRLIGQRQAFIKALAFPLNRLPGVSGATVLGDGSVVFVVDPPSLLQGRPGQPARVPT